MLEIVSRFPPELGDHMITIKQARKILGKQAENFTNEQIEQLLYQLTALAEIAIDSATSQGSNKQLGVLDQLYPEDHNGDK